PGIPDVMDASRDEAELEAVAAASEAATSAADLAEGVPAPAEDWVPEDETPLRDGAAAEEAAEVPIEEAAEVPIEEAIEAPIAVAVAVDVRQPEPASTGGRPGADLVAEVETPAEEVEEPVVAATAPVGIGEPEPTEMAPA